MTNQAVWAPLTSRWPLQYRGVFRCLSPSGLWLSGSMPWGSRICPGFVRWPSPLPRESLRSKPCKQSAHESHVSDGRNGQSRRSDVRLHHWTVRPGGWIVLHGMPVTRPSRIAADVLETRKTPKRSHRSLPMLCGLSTTTQVRSWTLSRRMLRVSGSGEGMASRFFAGFSTRLATGNAPMDGGGEGARRTLRR